MANQLKPISKEYLISTLKEFEKNILNKKYQGNGVQPDWDESDADSASFIKNKPESMPASDVFDWAKKRQKPSYDKSEVGLSNVPNVITNDQTPTYTEASELQELQSGEKLSDAFGKIARAIIDLIAQQEALDNKVDKTTVAKSDQLGLIKSGEDIVVDSDGKVSIVNNSHNHKVENITDLTVSTNELNHLSGVTSNIQAQLDGKAPTTHTHDDRYYTEEEIDAKLTENSASQQASANSAVSSHNTSSSAHSDIRDLISDLTTRLNALADSDDITLDQLSEIVSYIKNNKDLIDGVTTSKINVSDIVDGLNSTATDKPISANQGKVLNDLITALTTTVGDKVDKASGKGLSTNDYSTDDKNKLDGIASGAEVNVQPDWNETDTESDAYIKNKPTSMPASDVYEVNAP